MPSERICPEHGRYNATLGECPKCSQEQAKKRRPAAPRPLDHDVRTELDTPHGPPARRIELDPTLLEDKPRSGRSFLDDPDIMPTPIHVPDDDDRTRPEGPAEHDLGLLGYLLVKSGPRRGQVHPIRHGTVIGRREGSVRVDDDGVSRAHAKFAIEEGRFVIGDLMTTNGTTVNGQKIKLPTPLTENDEIGIGGTIFVLKVLEPEQEAL